MRLQEAMRIARISAYPGCAVQVLKPPVAALRLLPPVVRPFNELAARLITLGLYSATEAAAFPGWKVPADRFGVAPRTVETYVERMA
jgi:hypothetical protein